MESQDEHGSSCGVEAEQLLEGFPRHHSLVKTTATRGDDKDRLLRSNCVFCHSHRKQKDQRVVPSNTDVRTIYLCKECGVPLHPECFGAWHNTKSDATCRSSAGNKEKKNVTSQQPAMKANSSIKLKEVFSDFSTTLSSPSALSSTSFKKIFSLLFGSEEDSFFKADFERLPCVVRHSSAEKKKIKNGAALDHVFSRHMLTQICSNKEQEIRVENNLSARRYSADHERESYQFDDENAVVTSGELKKLFKAGYTVQFYQPQRFSDILHHICAGFEYSFGTLAGASAYLTPAKTQGLAPHWDDVEVFIFQTEGTKLWHLWKGPRLPEEPSCDIARSSEYLKDVAPTEVLLHPGDILYLPRGTIHEAIAQDTFSTHVTVSVYQKYNMKSLLERAMPMLLQRLFDNESISSLRDGLPRKMPQLLGSQAALTNSSSGADCAKKRKKTLTSVQNILYSIASRIDLEDLDIAADTFHDDFVANRLPPPDESGAESPELTMAKIDGSRAMQSGDMKHLKDVFLRLCDPNFLHYRLIKMGDEPILFIGSCLDNDRMQHMGHPSIEPDETEDDTNALEISGSDFGSRSTESLSDEGEDAMKWVKFSLPANMLEVIRVLESSYNPEAVDPLDNALTVDELLAMLEPSSVGDDEVRCFDSIMCQLFFPCDLFYCFQILEALSALHRESLLTVYKIQKKGNEKSLGDNQSRKTKKRRV